MAQCPKCGALNPDGVLVCGRCGTQLPTPDNKIIMIVIAVVVIVIVAIIVAAIVSYVLVIGGSGPHIQTPAGHIVSIVESPTEARITFSSFSSNLNPMDARVLLSSSSGPDITYSFTAQPSSMYTDMVATEGSAIYTDYNYPDNRISGGDNILITGLTPGEEYEVKILHLPTSELCFLSGITTFTME